MADLFGEQGPSAPLAARMRPRRLDEYIGQSHLVGPGKPLRLCIEAGNLHSMVLWGPPGVGKTSFARLLAESMDAEFETLSAVQAGVKDIRTCAERARARRQSEGRQTILFVDEVHRFNKAQQDAFLPYVEEGDFIFVGATTENPSFELNNALLSRARVYVLKPLSEKELVRLLQRALTDPRGLGDDPIEITERHLELIARAADGDGRLALNYLEIASDLAHRHQGRREIDDKVLAEALQTSLRRFDKGGDLFYDQISALHKAVRGSDPDAALYWFARMLDGGCDPLYIARRVVRMASEEVANADPRALQVAINAWDVQERLGSPEGELAIAQAIVYIAVAPKSNAVYTAFKAAKADVARRPAYEVPLHLRNAPTGLMKNLGYGVEYRYAHDEEGAYAAGECYFPPEMQGTRYYQPTERGLERKIRDKLDYLRQLDEASSRRRYETDGRGGRDD